MGMTILETTETVGLLNAVVNRNYVSFDEYLEQSSDTRICEWVNGEIITMPGASFKHQNLSGFLLTIMRLFVLQKDLGIILHF